MAATIFSGFNANGDPVQDEIAAGAFLQVSDGHLIVSAASRSTLAVYAPGQWIKAFVS